MGRCGRRRFDSQRRPDDDRRCAGRERLEFTAAVTGTTVISGGGLLAEGGATLSLSTLKSYSGEVNSTDTLEATGAGSVLTLPKLATITEDTTSYVSRIQIEALAGGSVGLPLLTSITGGPVQLESDGTGAPEHQRINDPSGQRRPEI